jgi:hypothetical protein
MPADIVLFREHVDKHIVDIIKKDHADWVEDSGICPRCYNYYKKQLKPDSTENTLFRYIIIDTGEERLRLAVEFYNNATAKSIVDNLPIDSTVNTWGKEAYFKTNIDAPTKGATMDVKIGDIAYWLDGRALCIFFGPTPLSEGNKPVPASAVVVVGKIIGEFCSLNKIKEGSKVRVE